MGHPMARSHKVAEREARRHRNPHSTPDFNQHREARCEGCGTVTVFFRREGGKPPMPGHRKHLWCSTCGKLQRHRELAPVHYHYKPELFTFGQEEQP